MLSHVISSEKDSVNRRDHEKRNSQSSGQMISGRSRELYSVGLCVVALQNRQASYLTRTELIGAGLGTDCEKRVLLGFAVARDGLVG